MISWKHKCIFIHIPKTAGSSVESVVWPEVELRTEKELWMGMVKPYFNKYQTGGLQHLMAKHIIQEVGVDLFSAFFKFSIVRNPWDKATSQFEYMNERPDLCKFIGMKKNTEFKTYLELTQKINHVQWDHQWKFICDDSKNILVDEVVRFEELEVGINRIFSRLNEGESNKLGNLPHENKSNGRANYQEYYDQESKEMIQETYAEDIRLFGYHFD